MSFYDATYDAIYSIILPLKSHLNDIIIAYYHALAGNVDVYMYDLNL